MKETLRETQTLRARWL